jgi:hypothetical protein
MILNCILSCYIFVNGVGNLDTVHRNVKSLYSTENFYYIQLPKDEKLDGVRIEYTNSQVKKSACKELESE